MQTVLGFHGPGVPKSAMHAIDAKEGCVEELSQKSDWHRGASTHCVRVIGQGYPVRSLGWVDGATVTLALVARQRLI